MQSGKDQAWMPAWRLKLSCFSPVQSLETKCASGMAKSLTLGCSSETLAMLDHVGTSASYASLSHKLKVICGPTLMLRMGQKDILWPMLFGTLAWQRGQRTTLTIAKPFESSETWLASRGRKWGSFGALFKCSEGEALGKCFFHQVLLSPNGAQVHWFDVQISSFQTYDVLPSKT